MKTHYCLMLYLIPFMTVAAPAAPDYPGCDLNAQHQLRGEPGGSMPDVRQAHISMRANVLEADIGNARKARRLTASKAAALWQAVAQVRKDSDQLVKKQGFLSAAERASYDRALDRVASQLCLF